MQFIFFHLFKLPYKTIICTNTSINYFKQLLKQVQVELVIHTQLKHYKFYKSNSKTSRIT